MFLRPRREELEGFKPEFTILNLPGFQADPTLDGAASDCAVLVNFTDRAVAICGTWYAGEIKKTAFTILNALPPDRNVLPIHASAWGIADTPQNIVMLTADALGVLPPISQLSPEQAMYHFLSGYTSRVAGTEKGVTEPQATFSTCFGAPFMPRHPTVYAKMLGEKMARQHVRCWLVNTGWSGGGFGVGERMSIRHTLAMGRAAPDGRLASVARSTDVVGAAPPGRPLRLPLIAALALAFVSLALISGIAYIVVLAGAPGTAERLLVDRAARVVDAQVALVRSRLDPVAEHLELIAALAAHGRLDINSPVDMREALWVMMTKVPAISSAGFATFHLRIVRFIRYPERT